MIKFFRKIRQNLLSGGKTGKYLKYAIGEILLVMIGILLALQVNNWNEERKERLVEDAYLSNLQIDLLQDREGLNHIIDRRQSKIASADIILELFDGKVEFDEKIYLEREPASQDMLRWEQFDPNSNAFTEIISAGDLKLIENQDIKKRLLDLRAKYQRLKVYRDHVRREYDHYLYDPIIKNYDFRNISERQSEFNRFINDKTVKNGFHLAKSGNQHLMTISNEALHQVDTLISMIGNELKN